MTRDEVRIAEEARAATLCATLTNRERDVLVMLGQGLTYRSAGVALGISWNTVNTYAKHVHRKLDVATNAEAVVLATKAGLL